MHLHRQPHTAVFAHIEIHINHEATNLNHHITTIRHTHNHTLMHVDVAVSIDVLCLPKDINSNNNQYNNNKKTNVI